MSSERHEMGGGQPGAIRPVERALTALRARARRLLLTERVGSIAAAVIGVIFVAGSADYFLRAPVPVRMGGWVIGLVLLLGALFKLVAPVLRFRPGLTDIALRVERTEAGRSAALSGVLASGVEFAQDRKSGAFGEVVASEATRRFESSDLGAVRRELLRPAPARRAALAVVVTLLIGAGAWAATPTLAPIGFWRVVTPWDSPEWPKRTMVADVTNEQVHPAGTAVALRAALVKTDASPDRTRVEAHYFVRTPDGDGPERTSVLAFQEQRVTTDTDAEGDLFLRLIEPVLGETVAEGTSLVYWFETKDDRTPAQSMLLVEAPGVVSASATLAPPPYLADINEPVTLDLGPGQDERAAPGEVLAGSDLTLTINLNKPTPTETDNSAWVRSSLGQDVADLVESGQATLEAQGAQWTLTTRLDKPLALDVSLRDEHGIESPELASYLLRTRDDAPPSATVVEPIEDRSVLATAVVGLRGEARDDVRLSWVSLERVIARPIEGSRSTEPEPTELGVVIARAEPAPDADEAQRRELSVATQLNLSDLNVRPGDEVRVSVLARDAFELDGNTHGAVRSLERRLRVISQEEFTEQIWTALSNVRREAMQADERQAEAGDSAERAFAGERTERMQAEVSERVDAASEAVRQARERIRENRLNDAALDGVMSDAQRALEQAGEASVRAGEALDELTQAERDEGPNSDEAANARAEARDAQEEVRDRLGDLVEMLNQGEDLWSVRRDVERALAQQRDLRERTAETGQRTTGRDPGDLSPQERSELAEQGQEQRDLAEQVEEAVRSMLEQAAEMSESDPAAAQAMAEAAARAQRSGVSEQMQQASQEIEQNRTNNATAQQDEAIESLEQMLEDLAEGERNRDQVLRRQLASLIESLEALIVQQGTELALLTSANNEGRPLTGLDVGMMRVHQNTLGVLDEARGAARAVAPVVEKIEEAADEQVGAIGMLRGTQIDGEGAQAKEQSALEALIAARDAAQELDQEAAEREAMRKRENLKRAYQEALAEQVILREQTRELGAEAMDRRARARARANGDLQAQLRERIDEIRRATGELAETVMFDYAHDRLDESMGEAADRLRQAQADRRTGLVQDRSIRLLRSLIEALEDPENDEQFRQNEQPQQPSGQQGGQQNGEPRVTPELGELLLLRAMQVEALELTEMASESEPGDREMLADDAAKLQSELAEKASGLLNPDALGGEPSPFAPDPEPDGEPEPPAPEGSPV